MREELRRLQASGREAAQALNSFLKTLKRHHPEISSLVAASPQQLGVLQGLLGAHQAVVQSVLLQEKGFLFVFRGSPGAAASVDVVELNAGSALLGPKILRFRQLLQERVPLRARLVSLGAADSPDAAAELSALQRELSLELFGEVRRRDLLSGVEHVILVPNGPLHLLPWSALDWSGRFLTEVFALSHLGAASLIPAVAVRLEEAPLGDRLWALGDAMPPEPRWTRLEHAAAEICSIARHFPRRDLFLDRAAVLAALQQRDLGGAVVHLAVHGEAAGPRQTHLVLSDGYLDDNAIIGLRVRGSPLVVLSACETGLGERLSGDEVVSLANAFLLAGARSVVSTLWAVPDAGMRDLMTRFYDHLALGSGKAAALSAAKRELIAAGRPPIDWAGALISGF